MLTRDEIDDIIERFRDWLVETDAEIGHSDSGEHESRPTADSSSSHRFSLPLSVLPLVEQLTALRHEWKLQTKSSRTVEDTIERSVETLDRATQRFNSVQSDEEQAARQAAQPLVEAIIDVDESVSRAIDTLTSMHVAPPPVDISWQDIEDEFQRLPKWQRLAARGWQRRISRMYEEQADRPPDDQLAPLLDGLHMIQKKLKARLSQCQVERINAVGERVDPELMNVVALADDATLPPETVVDEVRPGYRWRGSVVRFAEVRASSGNNGDAAEPNS